MYISILGDSLSALEDHIPVDNESFYGFHNRPAGIFWPEQMWWGKVLAHFGWQLLVNESWSGSLVSKRPECEIQSYGCSDSRTGGLGKGAEQPDHIFVWIGSNDRGSCVRLYSEDPADISVAANAYRSMLGKLSRNYPKATIWCITLLRTRRSQYRIEEYSRMIRSCAEEAGCRLIDMLARQKECDTVDGLHPSEAGMEMIADVIIGAVEEQNGV